MKELSTAERIRRNAKLLQLVLAIGGNYFVYYYSLAILLISFFLYSVYKRPFFSIFGMLDFLFLLYYLFMFDTIWHRSQFSENMYWSVFAVCLAVTFFILPDSPFRFLFRNLNIISNLLLTGGLMTVCAFIFSRVDKYIHTNSTFTISDSMRKNQSAALLFIEEDESFLVKKELIESNMSLLDSTLASLWNMNEINKAENTIIEVYREANKRELRSLIVDYSIRKVLYKIENTRIATEFKFNFLRRMTTTGNKKRFLELLSNTRVSELGVTAKYYLLDAIQTLRLTRHERHSTVAQEAIKRILLSTEGEKMSELKTRIDNKGSVLSTHHLIYKDIKQETTREQIFKHITNQAEQVKVVFNYTTKQNLQMRPWRKILCDIDDTLFSSGGHFPAGIDATYPHHAFYPGALGFYKELDLGSHSSVDEFGGAWPDSHPGNLCFLSARPTVYKDVMERSVFKRFKYMANECGLHTTPMLLPGDITSGQSFVLNGDLKPMAEKKFKNFEEYQKIYPEFKFIFIGDTGQADVKAAELMLTKHAQKMEIVFIHQVSPVDQTYGFDEKWKNMNIKFFKTYVQAALIAYKNGLITLLGLRRISLNIPSDFERIEWKDELLQERARSELNSHLIQVNKELDDQRKENPDLRLTHVNLIDATQKYTLGTEVCTPFGEGIVLGFNPTLNIYQVEIFSQRYNQQRSRSESFSTATSMPKTPLKQQFMIGIDNENYSTQTCNAFLNFNEVAFSTRRLLKKSKLKISFHRGQPSVKVHNIYSPGYIVDTPFGEVVKYRKYEKTFVLRSNELRQMMYFNETAMTRQEGNFFRSASETFSVLNKKGLVQRRIESYEVEVVKNLTNLRAGVIINTPFGLSKVLLVYIKAKKTMIELVGVEMKPYLLYLTKQFLQKYAKKGFNSPVKNKVLEVVEKQSILQSLSNKLSTSSFHSVMNRFMYWNTPTDDEILLFGKGSVVLTAYGYGSVLDTEKRGEHIIYTVGLCWGNSVIYLTKKDVLRELVSLEVWLFDKHNVFSKTPVVVKTVYGPSVQISESKLELYWTKINIEENRPSAVLYLGN